MVSMPGFSFTDFLMYDPTPVATGIVPDDPNTWVENITDPGAWFDNMNDQGLVITDASSIDPTLVMQGTTLSDDIIFDQAYHAPGDFLDFFNFDATWQGNNEGL
ncbi:hypothetical protein TWF696_005339 [Orbilia brochopaga]|uniref:Uncharacterized protein n=1 Tax=Orbilia brochopaga TaxID=3140254 RepID=A0AAV9V716_9PEZI